MSARIISLSNTNDGVTEKRIELYNGQIFRPIPIAYSDWNILRIAIRFALKAYDTRNLYGARLAIGLTSGSSSGSGYFDINCAGFVGYVGVINSADMFEYAPGNYVPTGYVAHYGTKSAGSFVNSLFCPRARVGTTYYNPANLISEGSGGALSADPAYPTVYYLDLLKNTPTGSNQTYWTFHTNAPNIPTNGISMSSQMTEENYLFYAEQYNPTLSYRSNNTRTDPFTGTNLDAITFDHVYVGWNRPLFPVIISDIALVKFA